ncbi:MAG: hypothetical protein KH149_04705, partial [Clostridiales bacterium]|nr:hypothetical protein [Clostridiales bacterium]
LKDFADRTAVQAIHPVRQMCLHANDSFSFHIYKLFSLYFTPIPPGFQHDCAKKSMKSRAFAHYEHGKATAAAK